jgi:hypothetical protein
MLSLPRIVAPVDFAERSLGAALRHFHSELTLLHVLDSGAYEVSAYEFTGPVVGALPAERRSEAEALLVQCRCDCFDLVCPHRPSFRQ